MLVAKRGEQMYFLDKGQMFGVFFFFNLVKVFPKIAFLIPVFRFLI